MMSDRLRKYLRQIDEETKVDNRIQELEDDYAEAKHHFDTEWIADNVELELQEELKERINYE